MSLIQKTLQFLLDIIYPITCLGCEEDGTYFCDACMGKILENGGGKLNVENIAYKMSGGKTVSGTARHDDKATQFPAPAQNRPRNQVNTIYLDEHIYCGSYKQNRVLQDAVHSFKYEFVRALQEPLAYLMTQVFSQQKTVSTSRLITVPIPLHPKRLRWRGFNQSELLALGFGKNAAIPMSPLLSRSHFARPQMELGHDARIKNVDGVFVINPLHEIPSDAHIILIDDVATTFATLNSAAKVLKEAGIKHVTSFTLALA